METEFYLKQGAPKLQELETRKLLKEADND